MSYKQLAERIEAVVAEKQATIVISHLNPDGDAIGSATALGLFLHKLHVPVTVIIPNELPEFLQWLPGTELLLTYTEKKEQCLEKLAEAKNILMVDFNEPGRAGKLERHIQGSTAYKVLLDHHRNPDDFVDLMISEPWRASAGEMVYTLFKESGRADVVDADIATCLYVAIMTDTGNFRYGTAYADLFRVAADLVEYGIDKDTIYSKIYDSYSEQRMKLLGYALSEKMEVIPGYPAAYISLSQEEMSS